MADPEKQSEYSETSDGKRAIRTVFNALAPNSHRVSSGITYNATEILGYRVLLKGSGDLIISPVGGAADVTITAAELTEQGVMAYDKQPEHLDEITAGAGMEVLVYIP